MCKRRIARICGAVLLAICPITAAQDFTIDPLSPEITSNLWGPGDMIFDPGVPPIRTACQTNLGLPATANVDGFTYGMDIPLTVNPAARSIITFSVTRLSKGVAGSLVDTQAFGNGAAGDSFKLTIDGAGNVLARTLRADAPTTGLTPLLAPFPPALPESENDGHSNMIVMTIPGFSAIPGAWFTVDRPTAAAIGAGPADILYRAGVIIAAPPPPACITTAASVYSTYATAADLGLMAGDNIDALAMRDITTPGMLNTGDVVYVSLDPMSPTLAAIGASPASMIQVFPGPPTEVITPAQFDLLPTDDIDALTLGDPEPCLGDINWDGFIDGRDIGPFLQILQDQLEFAINNPDCPVIAADLNQDFQIDLFDLNAFIDQLMQGQPCPAGP